MGSCKCFNQSVVVSAGKRALWGWAGMAAPLVSQIMAISSDERAGWVTRSLILTWWWQASKKTMRSRQGVLRPRPWN